MFGDFGFSDASLFCPLSLVVVVVAAAARAAKQTCRRRFRSRRSIASPHSLALTIVASLITCARARRQRRLFHVVVPPLTAVVSADGGGDGGDGGDGDDERRS